MGESALEHLSCLHCTMQSCEYWTLPGYDWLLLVTVAIGRMLQLDS